MQQKIVNYCGNCPFFFTEYDFANRDFGVHICNLSKFNKEEEYYLNFETHLDTPDWCPLKKMECSFKFKKFSKSRLAEISNVNKEIQDLEKYFEQNQQSKDTEFIEKSNRISKLYSKLNNLHENEDIISQEDIQSEIVEKISEIKNQLSELEDASAKLTDAFNKLGNMNDYL